jgi:uncharacterized protein (UPF0261 family)
MTDIRRGKARTIVVIGALDTKGAEVAFLRDQIEDRGHRVLVIDSGVLGEPSFAPTITRNEVAAAGGTPLADLVAESDRGHAVTVMTDGMRSVVARLYQEG